VGSKKEEPKNKAAFFGFATISYVEKDRTVSLKD